MSTQRIYRRLEKHNDVINQYGSYHYSKWGNMGGVLSMAAENETINEVGDNYSAYHALVRISVGRGVRNSEFSSTWFEISCNFL